MDGECRNREEDWVLPRRVGAGMFPKGRPGDEGDQAWDTGLLECVQYSGAWEGGVGCGRIWGAVR